MKKMKSVIGLLCFIALILSCSGNGTIAGDNPEQDILKDTVDLSGWSTALGVNYNEQLQFIDFNDLKRTETTWVRGFIDFFQLYDKPASLHTDEKVTNYLALKDHGYKTILNIKWNFKGREESLSAGNSIETKAYLDFLNQLLEKVWYKTDMLVIGNEPFIETLIEERDQRLVDFYTTIARAVEKFRDHHPNHFVPIFIGAFNNLHDLAWRTETVDQLLNFAKSELGIAGVDLHVHHAEMDQMDAALKFVSSRIRDNQKILVTEFSLMKYWKIQLDDVISEPFSIQYKYNASMKNYQYIDFALKNPRPATEWFDFLQKSTWFELHKHYLEHAYNLMTGEPKFLMATYAIRQSFPLNQDFTVGTDPWVLNGLFANRTVEIDPLSGHNQLNYSFIDDFIFIQK